MGDHYSQEELEELRRQRAYRESIEENWVVEDNMGDYASDAYKEKRKELADNISPEEIKCLEEFVNRFNSLARLYALRIGQEDRYPALSYRLDAIRRGGSIDLVLERCSLHTPYRHCSIGSKEPSDF